MLDKQNDIRHWYGLAISLVYPNGEGGGFTSAMDFYLPSRRLEGGQHPLVSTTSF